MFDIIKNSIFRHIKHIVKLVNTETIIVGIFMLMHFIIGTNKAYLLAIIGLFLVLYKYNSNILETLWMTFLAVIPFGKGRFFTHTVLLSDNWRGDTDLVIRVTLLFSDVILVLILYFISTRYKKLKRKFSLRSNNPKIFIIVFLIIVSAGISLFFAEYPFTSGYFYIQLIKYLVIFSVSLLIFSKDEIAKKSMQIIGLYIFINAIMVIAQYINSGPIGLNIEGSGPLYGFYAVEDPGLYRPGGFSADPNISGTLFAVYFPIAFMKTLTSRKKDRLYYWIFTGLLLIALLFTASRASWLITFISSFTLMFYLKKIKRIKLLKSMKKYATILLILGLFVGRSAIVSRLETIPQIFSKAGGATYRLEHLIAGWKIMLSNPFGVGVGLFPITLAKDISLAELGLRPTLAHNVLAQFGAEMGIFGLILFILFIFFIIRNPMQRLLKKKNIGIENVAFFLALLSFVLSLMFFPWVLHPSIAWLFWMMAAYQYFRSIHYN